MIRTSVFVARLIPLGLLFGVACGTAAPTSPEGAGSAKNETTSAEDNSLLAPGDQWVADNAMNDEPMHLVARAFVGDRTEVMSIYEPSPGRVLVVTAGHPNGPSQLAQLGGK